MYKKMKKRQFNVLNKLLNKGTREPYTRFIN